MPAEEPQTPVEIVSAIKAKFPDAESQLVYMVEELQRGEKLLLDSIVDVWVKFQLTRLFHKLALKAVPGGRGSGSSTFAYVRSAETPKNLRKLFHKVLKFSSSEVDEGSEEEVTKDKSVKSDKKKEMEMEKKETKDSKKRTTSKEERKKKHKHKHKHKNRRSTSRSSSSSSSSASSSSSSTSSSDGSKHKRHKHKKKHKHKHNGKHAKEQSTELEPVTIDAKKKNPNVDSSPQLPSAVGSSSSSSSSSSSVSLKQVAETNGVEQSHETAPPSAPSPPTAENNPYETGFIGPRFSAEQLGISAPSDDDEFDTANAAFANRNNASEAEKSKEKEKAKSKSSATKSKREEWMVVPPQMEGMSGELFGVSRKFSLDGKAATCVTGTRAGSSWTRVPKPAGGADEDADSSGGEQGESGDADEDPIARARALQEVEHARRRDEEMSAAVESYYATHERRSLVDVHEDSRARAAKRKLDSGQSLSEGAVVGQIWDRERDFLSFGQVDSKKLESVTRDPGKQLQSKFSNARSGSKFL